ncbi:MAG: hypothetical protein PUC32_01890 [Oscillospiraceae bacterium]|nr:hypothetical protein [Oscillospiraceae bacterium]
MGSRILSFVTLALSFAASLLLILAAILPTPQTLGETASITLCLVSAAMFLLALRFNITALRHDLTSRMIMPNAGLLCVSAFLIFLFIRHFVVIPQIATYIVLGGLVACFLVIFVGYWVQRRRSY